MELSRWHQLMKVFNLADNNSRFHSLQQAYSEEHRHYHTQQHINACLAHLHNSNHLTPNPYEIEMALWFHDAIYQPYSSDNELKSALLVENFLLENNVEKTIIARIYNLVMVTLHNGLANTEDEALMIDIDLTILGSNADVYNIFEKNIRKEYRFVPYFLYKKKRAEILQGFLKQAKIYQTKYFYTLFEIQARENIQAAILNL